MRGDRVNIRAGSDVHSIAAHRYLGLRERETMPEVVEQLLAILRGMWQRRWIGLGVAWLAAIIGTIVVFRLPDKYEASARVYVDTQSLLQPLMAGMAISPDAGQQVSILSRLLLSRPNLEKIIRKPN